MKRRDDCGEKRSDNAKRPMSEMTYNMNREQGKCKETNTGSFFSVDDAISHMY